LDSVDLSQALAKIKSLSLSLSHHVIEEEAPDSLPSAERHVNASGRLLGLCPKLEKLELCWYKLHSTNLSEAMIEEQRFFTHIVELAQLSQLRSCRLEGIETDESTLLAFFNKASQLSRLTMEEIHLKIGKFGPVFNVISGELQHLEYLHLEDLWESRLICFEGPGKSVMPTSNKSDGPNSLTREVDELRRRRRGIGYRLMKGQVLGSAQAANWRRRELLYGPP
jgi:hypothetical protein